MLYEVITIGKSAPAFTLPVIGQPNATFSPEANKGKVWLLNVWAPWCVASYNFV